MARCEVCWEEVPDVDILDHLRVMHPDDYGYGPDVWPDGKPVVLDLTLMPEDFG